MEGAAVCGRCRKTRDLCFRAGSAKRGRGRPAKNPVIIGGMTYSRCTSCQAANVTCHTTVPREEIATQQAQLKSTKGSASRPLASRPAAPIPVEITNSGFDAEHSPYGTHSLFEDATLIIHRAADVVEGSIERLRTCVDDLKECADSMGPQTPPRTPGRQSQSFIKEDRHRAAVRHYALPSIQESIKISNNSILQLQGALDGIIAAPFRLPPIDSDSDELEEDGLDDEWE